MTTLLSAAFDFVSSSAPSILGYLSEAAAYLPSLEQVFVIGALWAGMSNLRTPPSSPVPSPSSKLGQTVERHSPRGQMKEKSMLIVSTTHDASNAGSTFIPEIKGFAKKHSIDLLEGENGPDLKEKMAAIQQKFDTIVVHAHSYFDPQSQSVKIQLAKTAWITKNSANTLKWFRDRLAAGGKIILHCCSTALGEDNIARAFSRACPQGRVYATSAILNGFIGVEYDDDATPTFNNGGFYMGRFIKGQNSTHIYEAGRLVHG